MEDLSGFSRMETCEVNLNENEVNCEQLSNPDIYRIRNHSGKTNWTKIVIPPAVGLATHGY